jgi:predicted ATPase
VREAGGQSLLETLKSFLREKSLLLVLDNFEQVLDAAPTVAELLSCSPRLKVLVTSRALLRLRGEQEGAVPPLTLPDPRRLPPLPALSQYGAVALFIQRAVTAKPEFAVTNENAPAVAEICHRLDGLPLAIELAAARIRLFSPESLLARLGTAKRQGLKLLVGGARDLPARQQTLQNTIGWSYDLLNAPEQMLFRRLTVFAGGFTLEAAEALGGEGDPLELLASLIEKSLVRQEDIAGETRFWMLETIREYGADRLREAGEAIAVRDRHLDFFLALAEEAEPRLHGREQLAWLARLEAEHDNLRAALEWSGAEERHAEAALRLAGALAWFWNMRGYLHEGRRWLEDLLERPAPAGATRARALDGAGLLAFYQDDFDAAPARFAESVALWRELGDRRALAHAMSWLGGCSEYSRRIPLLEESVALAREVGDPWVLGLTLWHLAINVLRFQSDPERVRKLAKESTALLREVGDLWSLGRPLGTLAFVAWGQGDLAAAVVYFEEALAAARTVGDKWGIATTLSFLVAVAREQGDYAAAQALLEEGLAIFREAGDKPRTVHSLSSLAEVAQAQGDDEKARALCEDAISLARELEDTHSLMHSLAAIGHVARQQGDYGRARDLYQESLVLRQEMRDTHAIAQSLEDFAVLAGKQQQWERAARLLGAAEAVCVDLGRALPVANPAEYWRTVSDARRALGEEAFAAAWAEGRAMTSEGAITLALESRTLPEDKSQPP